MQTGLVSVTFRQLTPEQIVALVKEAGLDGIEWGGDIHCPPGDKEKAQSIAALMAEGGLAAISYGSYYRTGSFEDFEGYIDTARILGTKNIRVWAGKLASDEAGADDWARSVEDTRRICDAAAGHGIDISFEYHANTLTDTQAGTVRLLEEIGRGNCYTYWQPPTGITYEENIRSIRQLADMGKLMNIHVCAPAARSPLSERREEWVRYIGEASPRRPALLLEFVKDNDPDCFLEDAKTLRSLAGV